MMEGRESWAEGGVCTHWCPGLPSPWEEKSPPTCPKPQKASERTRSTSQFPKLMGHP